MQIKELKNEELNCLITEVVTSNARVFVVSDRDNGHASNPATLQTKQFIRNLVSEDIRECEAVFYICTVPTDLIVYFPCDIPQYMSKELRSSYPQYSLEKTPANLKGDENTWLKGTIDGWTLPALENVQTLLPFRERPAQYVGKRMLWIDHEVSIGDIEVKAFKIPVSTEGVLKLSVEADGHKIFIPND